MCAAVVAAAVSANAWAGYPAAFDTALSNAAVHVEHARPVDAIEAYRNALRSVSPATITNDAIPYAKALYALAQQFMYLQRWADAQAVLSHVVQLSSNMSAAADLALCQAARAMALDEVSTMEVHACAALAATPRPHWQAHHMAALGAYARGDLPAAQERWADGLRAVARGQKPEVVFEYLAAAQCYWKCFAEENVLLLAEALDDAIAGSAGRAQGEPLQERLWCERVKLQTLFPETVAPRPITNVSAAAAVETEPRAAALWLPRSNYVPVIACLAGDQWEKSISAARLLEVRREYVQAWDAYRQILQDTGHPSNCWARVEAQDPYFFALCRVVALGQILPPQDSARRTVCTAMVERLLPAMADANVAQGIALAPEYVYGGLMGKIKQDTAGRGRVGRLIEALVLADAYTSSPRPATILAAYESEQGRPLASIDDGVRAIDKILAMVSYRTGLELWGQAMMILDNVARMPAVARAIVSNEAMSRTYFTAHTRIAFDALARAVTDYAAPALDVCRADFADVRYIDPYKKLRELAWQGLLSHDQCRILYEWLGSYGISVPAVAAHLPLVRSIVRERAVFAPVVRTTPFRMNLLCDAGAWSDCTAVYAYVDYQAAPIELRPITGDQAAEFPVVAGRMNVWCAALDVPVGHDIVQCRFQRTALLSQPQGSSTWQHVFTLFERSAGTPCVLLCARRETPCTLLIECDTRARRAQRVVINYMVQTAGTLTDLHEMTLHDDGTAGDTQAADGVFSATLTVPADAAKVMFYFVANDAVRAPSPTETWSMPANSATATAVVYRVLRNRQ